MRLSLSELDRLSDDELFARLRRARDAPARPAPNPYRDELVRRLQPRLVRFFASLARSSGLQFDEVRDLVDDLVQETIIRVAADASTLRYLFSTATAESQAAPLDPMEFPRVNQDPFRYAFRTARNVWNSRVPAESRRRRRGLEADAERTAPSPWEVMLQGESEREWEARLRYGERLREAEAECVRQLAARPPSARAHPRMNQWVAELWIWCSLQKGSAAAYYAAMGLGGRNTTRDLRTAETFMNACLEAKGIAREVVGALCGFVMNCAVAAASGEAAWMPRKT